MKLRRDRIAVALDHRVLIYNFADLRLIYQWETIYNGKGLLAVSSQVDNTVVACPGVHVGQVRAYPLLSSVAGCLLTSNVASYPAAMCVIEPSCELSQQLPMLCLGCVLNSVRSSGIPVIHAADGNRRYNNASLCRSGLS